MVHGTHYSFCPHILFTILIVSNTYIAQSVRDNLYEFIRYVIFSSIYLLALGKYVHNLDRMGVYQYREKFHIPGVKKMGFVKCQE